MKKILLSVFAIILFGAGLTAATYTRQTARVIRFQCDPAYDGTGTVTAVPIQSFLIQRLVNDADSTDVRGGAEIKPVNFDLLDASLAGTTITAAGKTVTYPQLAALMRQAVLDRANAAGIQ